ncbi:globin domain-containing protein [Streptomyces sp. NPDC006638]|uniref:globin domain-containing protein n=1 Tax=Streptomyces sp. NPDC006638 TaxID=3157183 RepID=UPI0033BCD1BE
MPPRPVLPSAALPDEVPLPAEAPVRQAAPSAAAPPERPSAELPDLARPDGAQPGLTRPDSARRGRGRPLPVEPDLPQHGRAESQEQPLPSAPVSTSGALPPEVPVPAAQPAPAPRPEPPTPTAAPPNPGPPSAPSASAAPGAESPSAELPPAEPSPAAAPPAAAGAPGAQPPAAVPPPESPAPTPAPASAAPVEDPNASPDAILIRRTLGEIGPVADQVTSYFYALLFVRHPDLRSLFPVAMDAQRDRLLKALLTAAEHMDSPAVLTDYLRQLGRGHRKYGTRATHYPAVGEALIGALTRYATNTWDEETEGAWVRTYTTISQIMIDAAAENEQHAPAWWQAEVVSHELRTSDIAVVTVRPDQPYPFLAGQYTSLETPWWPRVWRHYSFASAPRPDGLLAFHVKAVPAGWVSNALVHRATPGDVLRLGPPAGSMTVDHSTDNGLLCLGGGTGIAPIKALVEDVAERGHRRPVEVFYGARHDQDLYDIDTMLRLQQVHPWLSVRPVVSEGPSLGLTGRLPEAVRDSGPWHEYDGYLSGPPGMIRSGVDALRGAGIPSERIRHDSLEELVAAAT